VIALFLVLIALAVTVYSPMFMAVLWLILSLLLIIPPTKDFIHLKIGISEQPIKIIRIITIGLLVVSSAILAGRFQANKIREKEAQMKIKIIRAHKIVRMKRIAKRIAYFNSHRSAILHKLRSDLHAGMFKKVITLSSKYIPVKNKDKDLININNEAKKRLENRKLVAILRKTPSSDYQKRMSLYHQLSTNNPHIALYTKKRAYYKGLIAEAKRKRARLIAKFGEPPERDSWDGSYYVMG